MVSSPIELLKPIPGGNFPTCSIGLYNHVHAARDTGARSGRSSPVVGRPRMHHGGFGGFVLGPPPAGLVGSSPDARGRPRPATEGPDRWRMGDESYGPNKPCLGLGGP